MTALRRILVAIDLTPACEAVFARALLLAKKAGAELLVAHVYRPPNVALAEAVAPGVYEEWDQNLRSAVTRRLEPFLQSARRQLVPTVPLVLSGAPRKRIVEAAKRMQADLIVVGSRHRRGLTKFFDWSFASRIASSAPCRVMTARAVPSDIFDPFLHAAS